MLSSFKGVPVLDRVAANLILLRVRKGLTQEFVAEKAELSRLTYARIENGKSLPRVDVLDRLAEAVGVQAAELLKPASVLPAVRFRAQKQLKGREEILARVQIWLESYQRLEKALGRRSAPDIISRVKSSPSDPVGAARSMRTALGLKPSDAISDLCATLEDRGIKVLTISAARAGFFGLSVAAASGGPAIVINTWDRIPVERWQFTLAHELAHLVLHKASFNREARTEDKDEEREANAFAGEFLMPSDAFKAAWERTTGAPFVDRVLKVKRLFGVSYRVVLYALSPEVPHVWMKFQMLYRQRYGTSLKVADEPERLQPGKFHAGYRPVVDKPRDEPDRLSPSYFVGSRMNQLACEALKTKKLSESEVCEILGYDKKRMEEWKKSCAGEL